MARDADSDAATLGAGDDPAAEPGSGRSYVLRGQTVAAPSLAPGLHVVATPIGHLADVTIRALDTLAAADLVACEDTRLTRRLLDRYGIRARPIAYHEHSPPAVERRILAALGEGGSVALVSDAGTPLVSDPGARLVAAAIAAGVAVVPVPGASAVIAALSAAGLPTEAFVFAGFPPNRAAARAKRLAGLARAPGTLVLYEAPGRVAACLADALQALGDRPAVVARELTKIHETFDRGTLAELAARYDGVELRGEVVILIAPAPDDAPPGPDDIDRRLRLALAELGVKDAAQAVADATGAPRRDLYRRALALKAEDGG